MTVTANNRVVKIASFEKTTRFINTIYTFRVSGIGQAPGWVLNNEEDFRPKARWQLKELPDGEGMYNTGRYHIMNMHSGKYLYSTGGKFAGVSSLPDGDAPYHTWQIEAYNYGPVVMCTFQNMGDQNFLQYEVWE